MNVSFYEESFLELAISQRQKLNFCGGKVVRTGYWNNNLTVCASTLRHLVHLLKRGQTLQK